MLGNLPRKIVVGVGADEDIQAALEFAAAEARRRGVGVHLVHVLHPVLISPDGVPITVEERAVRKYGRAALDDAALWLEHRLPDELPVSTELVHGPVTGALVDAAERACLVVLQHQRMGRRSLVPTLSTTNPVAALSPAPVVAVPAGWVEAGAPRGVTVGVEDPATSYGVVRAALDEARLRGSKLRVLHTWHHSDAYDDLVFEGQAGRTHEAQRAQDLTTAFNTLFAEYPDVDTEILVQHARAADALVAESGRASLLVLGRHRFAIPLGPHLGSVVRAVLRHATSPVMVVDPVPADVARLGSGAEKAPTTHYQEA